MGTVTELSRLSPKLRQIQASVTAELNKLKSMCQKLAFAAKAKSPEALAQEKAKEEEDAKDLADSLPAAAEIVTAAEEAAEAIAAMAAPLIDEPPDQEGDVLKRALEEIETNAVEAQNKITEARKQVNVKLQGARKYAPETRKKALEEFSALQTKLTEAQKKV